MKTKLRRLLARLLLICFAGDGSEKKSDKKQAYEKPFFESHF
jgi:hypothetical protein